MYVGGGRDFSTIMNEPLYITENNRISETLRTMQRKKSHMAVVIDQYGGTEGICTLEDIIEELVGEIYDESDEEDTSFIKISDREFDVSAELSVSDFLDRTDMPQNTISTDRHSMGGWVMDLLDRIPTNGERIVSPPFDMVTVMQDEQKIERIKIKITEPEGSEDTEKQQEEN
jgi:CBS domain containing-hemolysin-like protein